MFVKVIKFGLKIFIKTYPIFFFFEIILGIVHSLSNGFATLYTQRFFDSIEDIILNSEPLSKAYLMIIIIGSIFIMREIIEAIHDFLFSVLLNKPRGEIMKVIHSKIARIDPICFEDTNFHDSIEKVNSGADGIVSVVTYIIVLVSVYLPYAIFMSIYLHHLKPHLVWIIVLVFIPTLFAQLIRTGIIAKFEDKIAPINREYNYYGQTITGKNYYKETRKLSAYNFFIIRFLKSMKNLGKAEWEKNKKVNILQLGMNLIIAIGYAGILYILVTALLSDDITVGAFAAIFASIDRLFHTMDNIFKEGIGDMAADMGKARNFIRFMELPERGGMDLVPDSRKGITVENVSFKYPNAECKSVDNVSFEIKAGETIAIVGENGAGKTTLVRLLIGLYLPTSGTITMNGMETSTTNYKSLFSNLSGVFQHFQCYQMTLDENIKIADFINGNKTDSVLLESGVDFENKETFPIGKNTMLSREFDGVDLSGGQWQRIAIARGLYRIHNIIILDEPTAAIDPIEESRIYRKFIKISKGKTAIIVTHRLGSTKIADRVIVMNKGEIVNIGTHEELLHHSNLYTEMFRSQAIWYENDSDVITEHNLNIDT